MFIIIASVSEKYHAQALKNYSVDMQVLLNFQNQHDVAMAGRCPPLANPGHHHIFITPWCILFECEIHSTIIL